MPLLLLGAIVAGGTAMAERRKGLAESLRPGRALPTRKIAPPLPPRNLVVVERDDTIWCTRTLSVGSWQIPLDTVPAQDAAEYPFVVRMSNKNKKGHFGRIEVFRKGLVPTVYEGSMSILENTPDSLHSENLPSLSIHRIDIMSDSEGEMSIQERYYDTENNLLFYINSVCAGTDPLAYVETCYQPSGVPFNLAKTPYGKNIKPAAFYDETRTTKICVLWDGNKFIPSKNGAYKRVINFDPEKRVETTVYVDEDNNIMSGKNGYAKMRTFYSPTMVPDSIVYYDTEGNAIEVPDNELEPEYSGVSKRVFRFDDYRQMTSQSYYGLHDKPVESGRGTHITRYGYDEYGNRTLVEAFGLDGKPALCDNNDWSKWTAVMDSVGNILEYHQYDAMMRPVSKDGEYSSFYNTYAANGERTSLRNYVADEKGTEKLSFSYELTPEGSETHFSDGGRKFIKNDSKGRMLEERIVDEKGGLFAGLEVPLETREYIDGPDGNVKSIQKYYNDRGVLANVFTADSTARERIWYAYDEKGRKTDANIQWYDEGWNNVVWQGPINGFDVPTRICTPSSPLCYRVNVDKTLTGDYYNLQAVDEFGEADYMVYEDWSVSHANASNTDPKHTYHPVDWQDNEIESLDKFKRTTPKYMSIEVVDSTAYSLGLRDNDIILHYGERYYPAAQFGDGDFLAEWTVEEVFCTPVEKNISVFRIDSTEPEKCSIRTFKLPAGTTKDLGFLTHLTYKTPKQEARILATMKAAGFDLLDVEHSIDANSVVAAFPQMSLSFSNYGYGEAIGTPAILISAYIEEMPEMRWREGMDYDELDKVFNLIQPSSHSGFNARLHYFDGKEVKDIRMNAENNPSTSLRQAVRSVDYERASKIKAALKGVKYEKRATLREGTELASALTLYNNGMYKEASKIFDALAERGDSVAPAYSAMIYQNGLGTKRDMKKARHFAALGISAMERISSPTKDEVVALARLYAVEDSVKAASYLRDKIFDYNPSDDFFEAYDYVNTLHEYIKEYEKVARDIALDGEVYAAYHLYMKDLRYTTLIEQYMKPLYVSGHLKAPKIDMTEPFYKLLYDAIRYYPDYAEEYHRLLDDFLSDKVFTYVVIEKDGRAAYDRGMRGEYILLRHNDWTMLSNESWFAKDQKTDSDHQHLVLLTPEGEIIEEEFDGKIGIQMRLKTVGKEERERVISLLRQ